MHYSARAERVLSMIASLYAVESRAGAPGVAQERLPASRRRFSRPRLARLRRCLDELSVQVLPRSPLGRAISYTLKNWKTLNRSTEAVFLAIDHNLSAKK